tara:strand:- start:4748 stop:5899 length:1152 start_codon:yes stop_codon:yes gene_type:complete
MFKNKKKIVFLTGTRADFGKLKSLIKISTESDFLEVFIFVTGMHLEKKFGYTIDEVRKEGYKNIFSFKNKRSTDGMDVCLSNTIKGFSCYLNKIKPDLIIVHGDRVEALAGAITGSLNNILVAHIEGGEVSGTIDELIRHAVTKMSHIHFAANKQSAKRLIQLGELDSSIHIIGSPDLDLMNPKRIPSLSLVKNHYGIDYQDYAIAMFHPVTTELDEATKNIKSFVNALIESKKNYVLIYPNNDLGSQIIIDEYKRLKTNKNFKIYPSLRFEYFLTLLFNCNFIIGNSSAGIREAPFYKRMSIDVGTRQQNRYSGDTIIHTDNKKSHIINAINSLNDRQKNKHHKQESYFGSGNSDKKFIKILKKESFWSTNKQKQFQDMLKK